MINLRHRHTRCNLHVATVRGTEERYSVQEDYFRCVVAQAHRISRRQQFDTRRVGEDRVTISTSSSRRYRHDRLRRVVVHYRYGARARE